MPVHGRAGITRLCLEQKAHLLGELAALGVEAHILVVGDDENVATARELGFQVLERSNVLGRKLNDGFEFACREGCADYVSFVGSDDWMLAEFMADLPAHNKVRSASVQAFVSPQGDELLVRRAKGSMGGAPWIIPTTLLERSEYRPILPDREHKMSGMDFLVARGLMSRHFSPGRVIGRQAMAEKREMLTLFDRSPTDDLRMVDFKGSGEQITSWSLVLPKQRISLIRSEPDPWAALATRYPLPLVERMQRLYADGLA